MDFGTSSGVASFLGPGAKVMLIVCFLLKKKEEKKAGLVTFVMYDPHLGVAY